MVNEAILTERSKKIARRYIERVRNSGIEVAEALIFGSQAKGTATKGSDIDLAVVSPQFGKDAHKELVSLFKLVDRETKEIEPIPFAPHEFEDNYNSLAIEVRRFGIPISL